jgi:hypothetical protein
MILSESKKGLHQHVHYSTVCAHTHTWWEGGMEILKHGFNKDYKWYSFGCKCTRIEPLNTLIATMDISVIVEHVAWYYCSIWGLPANSWTQGCSNCRCQFTWTTNFCTMAPNMCRSSVWNILDVILLAPRILRWLGFFEKFVYTCLDSFLATVVWLLLACCSSLCKEVFALWLVSVLMHIIVSDNSW